MPFLALFFCLCIDHDPLASVYLLNPSGIAHRTTKTTRDVATRRLSAFKVKRRENHMDINFMKIGELVRILYESGHLVYFVSY